MNEQTQALLAILKRMRAYLMQCNPPKTDPLGAGWGQLMGDSGRVIADAEKKS